MSDAVAKAVAALAEKLQDADFGGTAKFEISDEGSVMVDGNQSPPAVSAGDGEADVTIAADAETFAEMMSGDLDPTGAYMSGRLRIDGDMGLAMKLATHLA